MLPGAWVKALAVVSVLSAFAGCSSETAKKAEGSSSGSTSPAQTQTRETTGVQPPRAESKSSWDTHREGQAPVSGPLKDIFFEFDRYDLSSDARSILKINADWLRANPSVGVEIEGHCDERGTTDYNLALGAKRARAAQDYLVTLGISAVRIKTISYGEELPVCRDTNESCYQKNRRDRFVEGKARPTS